MRIMASVVAGAALLFGAHAANAKEIFKVGVIASYTGAFATWGSQFQNAIEAYQALHGKTVKGPKGEEIEVQFVYRDAASAGADKAKQLMEELVLREKVRMIAGFELSHHAIAVAEIATQAKVPVLIMNASTASITRGSPYYVRVSNTLPQWGAALGKWSAENGIKRVYTIVSDYAAGIDTETAFHKAFKAAGGEIIGSARTPLSETNFSAYLERALQAKPDALYMFQPGGAPSISFVKAYVERGLKQAGIKLLGQSEFAELYLPNFPDDIVGTISALHYTETNKLPENAEMRAQLSKLFGAKGVTDIASVGAWDGVNLIYTALREVGASADGLTLIKAMTGKQLKSPRGPILIDPEERDIVQNIYIRRIEKVDGKLQNIDIATVEMMKDPWKLENPAKK